MISACKKEGGRRGGEEKRGEERRGEERRREGRRGEWRRGEGGTLTKLVTSTMRDEARYLPRRVKNESARRVTKKKMANYTLIKMSKSSHHEGRGKGYSIKEHQRIARIELEKLGELLMAKDSAKHCAR